MIFDNFVKDACNENVSMELYIALRIHMEY